MSKQGSPSQSESEAGLSLHAAQVRAFLEAAEEVDLDEETMEDILAGCERLRASNAEVAFLPHATTWLNGERWNDELPDAPRPAARASPPERSSPGSRLMDRMEARRSVPYCPAHGPSKT